MIKISRSYSLRSKVAFALTTMILVSACSGSSKDPVAETIVTTTVEPTTTTTVDPNLDPFYPELGDAWGIGNELAAQYGPDVAAYCLLVNDMSANLPDSASNRDIEAIGRRLESGLDEVYPLKPYMNGLLTIAENMKEVSPKKMTWLPASVQSEEMARNTLDSYKKEQTPSCLDTNFLDWLNYKGFIEQGKLVLGTK